MRPRDSEIVEVLRGGVAELDQATDRLCCDGTDLKHVDREAAAVIREGAVCRCAYKLGRLRETLGKLLAQIDGSDEERPR